MESAVCRSCLDLDGPFCSIFNASNLSCLAYLLISNFTGIKPIHSDGLPDKVCFACIREMVCCYSFWSKCWKSDHMLRQILLDAVPKKQEPTSIPIVKVKVEQMELSPVQQPTPQKSKENVNSQVCFDAANPAVENNADQTDSLNKTSDFGHEEQIKFILLNQQKLSQNKPAPQRLKKACIKKKRVNKKKESSELAGATQNVRQVQDQKQIKPSTQTLKQKCSESKEDSTAECVAMKKKAETNVVAAQSNANHNHEKKEMGNSKLNEYYTRTFKNKPEILFEIRKPTLYSKISADYPKNSADYPKNSADYPKNSADYLKNSANFPKTSTLVKHQSKYFKKQFQCNQCNYSSTEHSKLQSHIRTHSGLKRFQCVKCDYGCMEYSDLQNHMEIHAGEKEFHCNLCDKIFTQKINLRRHQLIIHTQKSFRCNQCAYNFALKADLEKHLLKHEIRKERLQCCYCGRSFIGIKELRAHELVHSGDKPFMCNFCGKGFMQKSYMLKHKNKHTVQVKDDYGSTHKRTKNTIKSSENNDQQQSVKDPKKNEKENTDDKKALKLTDGLMQDKNDNIKLGLAAELVAKDKEVLKQEEYLQVAEVFIKLEPEEEEAYNADKQLNF